MKFTIDVHEDENGYVAEGIISDRPYSLHSPNLHACLRAVAHLAEDIGRQRTPKLPQTKYTQIICNEW